MAQRIGIGGTVARSNCFVPNGEDLLQAEDTVYAIVTHEGRKPLVKMFLADELPSSQQNHWSSSLFLGLAKPSVWVMRIDLTLGMINSIR